MNSKTSLASRLRHRIVIESPVRTMDGAGGFTINWKEYAETWAEILPRSGLEFVEAEQIIATRKVVITIRYLRGLTEQMRIKYQEREFDIINILNPYEENILLEILAEEKSGN